MVARPDGPHAQLDGFYRELADLASSGVRDLLSRRQRVAQAVRALRQSGLFDGRDYARRHPEVAASGLSPAEHFLTVGYAAGLQAQPRRTAPEKRGARRRSAGIRADTSPPLAAAATRDTHHDEERSVRPTNLGTAFDDAVAHAVSRFRDRGQDPEYDLIREEFDPAHYLLQSPSLIGTDVDLVEHFMTRGVRANRSPSINFSMSTYRARQPDSDAAGSHPFVRWVGTGRAAGEIADPSPGTDRLAPIVGMAEPDLVATLAEMRTDLTERLRHGRLGEVWAKAAEIEPLVGAAWPETTRPKIQPAPVAVVVDQMALMHACHEQAGHRAARALIVVGGSGEALVRARRLVAELAATVEPSEIVCVLTDPRVDDDGDLPDGVRFVDFATSSAGIRRDVAQQVLTELLRTFRARSIVAVGSPLFLEALRFFGKALRASESIHLWLSHHEEGAWGQVDGEYLRDYYRFADILDGVIVDDVATVGLIADHYQLDDDALRRIRPFPDMLAADLSILLTGKEA